MLKLKNFPCLTFTNINCLIILTITSLFTYFLIQTKFHRENVTVTSRTIKVLDVNGNYSRVFESVLEDDVSIISQLNLTQLISQLNISIQLNTSNFTQNDTQLIKYLLKNLKTVNNRKISSDKPGCDLISQKLIGYKPYDLDQIKADIDENKVIKLLSSQRIAFGGKWSPPYCKPRHHVAILIPYRDREHHLKQFLLHMHPLFARQELSYGIYVIEPVRNITFNRGILLNIGFIESNKDSNDLWQCHACHDVDLISEDDRTLYHCPESPTHMSHRMNKYKYNPFYDTYFGGVTLISKEKYNISNGFSNLFFGWGGEDDDHYNRLAAKKYKLLFPPAPYGRYLMMGHDPDTPNPERFKLMKEGMQRIDNEGLNTIKYKLVKKIYYPLYTKFLVYYNETELLSKNYTAA